MKKRRLCIPAAILLSLGSYSAFSQGLPEGDRRFAVVEFSTNFMREEPEYEAENGDQALMGTVVEIVDEKSYWRRIVSPEPYTAWVNEMGLVEMDRAEAEAYIAAAKYICTADFTHIFATPNDSGERISDLVMGCLVRKELDSRGNPVKRGKYLAVRLPSGKEGWVLKKTVSDFSEWTASRKMRAEDISECAMRFLGVPYMWGGTSIKHVDCSGLSRSVYFMNGILLPRNASQQAKVGEEVPMDRLEEGDLLFFGTPASADRKERISHVGIYLGDGRYIHSSQVVRISSLNEEDEDYGGRKPIRARRILGHVDDGSGIVSISNSPYYFAQ